jgi:hypothetical protein
MIWCCLMKFNALFSEHRLTTDLYVNPNQGTADNKFHYVLDYLLIITDILHSKAQLFFIYNVVYNGTKILSIVV